MPFLDPLYLLLTAPAMLIAMWASGRVKSTFKRFSQYEVRAGLSGAEAAAAVLRAGGAMGCTIERHQGFLTDHYDPRSKTLRLSPAVFDGRSISSIAVAAHEAGHAIQHATDYPLLAMRSRMVPLQKAGSNLWMMVFFGGLMMQGTQLGYPLMLAGLFLFIGVVAFQLLTLPVEFDASNRAKAVLSQTGIVSSEEEAQGVKTVLRAAAMTYVAGALTSVATLLYLLIRVLGSRRG